MIEFKRYPHVIDLINHYSAALSRPEIDAILHSGMLSESDAETFSKFIWDMVGEMNEDEENGVEVLGSSDNSEMIPDISYEVTKLMRSCGYFHIWERISNEEI